MQSMCDACWQATFVSTKLPGAMVEKFPGRLYIRNLPGTWAWEDTQRWILQHHLEKPSHIHMMYGEDLGSCFVHFKSCTQGQLTTWQEHLCGQDLTGKPEKKTIVKIATDTGGPYSRPSQQTSPPLTPAQPPNFPIPPPPPPIPNPPPPPPAPPAVNQAVGTVAKSPGEVATGLKHFRNMLHTGSCRGQGRRWPYHGWLRGDNLCCTCDCCSLPLHCKACQVSCKQICVAHFFKQVHMWK